MRNKFKFQLKPHTCGSERGIMAGKAKPGLMGATGLPEDFLDKSINLAKEVVTEQMQAAIQNDDEGICGLDVFNVLIGSTEFAKLIDKYEIDTDDEYFYLYLGVLLQHTRRSTETMMERFNEFIGGLVESEEGGGHVIQIKI